MKIAQPKKSSSLWCCGGNTTDVVDPQVKQSEEKASAKSGTKGNDDSIVRSRSFAKEVNASTVEKKSIGLKNDNKHLLENSNLDSDEEDEFSIKSKPKSPSPIVIKPNVAVSDKKKDYYSSDEDEVFVEMN